MKKKTETTNIKSESESKSKSKIEPIEPLKKKTKTATKSKATTTTKGKSSCVKNRRQTDEEYMAAFAARCKRDKDHLNQCLAGMKILEAEKKKHEIQEFRNRLESLGYCFNPSDGKLIDYYLRSKNSGKEIAYCPIEELDVYVNHPQGLIENYLRNPGKVGYFFTCSRPNETHSGTNVQSHWIFGEMEDVLNNEGEKVGVKQVLQYGEGDHSTGYKIIEYRLDPAPVDRKTWVICKVLDDETA